SFTYAISDSEGLTDTANVVITVTGVNDAPLAYSDAYTAYMDTPLMVAAPGVLANDDDAEGDTLQALWDSGPANGELVLNADGSFVYTPTAGFYGLDSFGYHAYDGALDSDVFTVTLNVLEEACVELSTATLSLLTAGPIYPGEPVDFLLDLLPDGFSPPYNYTLNYGDGTVITDVSGLDPLTLTHSYAATGTYQVTVEVWNCAMAAPIGDGVQVVVGEAGMMYEIYLPLVLNAWGD
ncbi:MAG: cadherin-like domain-containing protein, partial [Chloroflexia bacterium]|nr:cadherin-like domain-containing protein [Chloroflexia bacterium]